MKLPFLKIRLVGLLGPLLLALSPSLQAGTLTPASGGESIPSETAGGTFTELTGPVYDEDNSGDVGAGSIVLQLPPGFEWDVSSPAPTALVEKTGNGGRNINNLNDGERISASSVTADQVTFEITHRSTGGNNANRLTFENLRVRPEQTSPEASGDIVHSGTSIIDGVTTGSTSWGYLEQEPLQQDVLVSANGETEGPVLVEAGETVDLAANVFNCPTDADRWRDNWAVDGTSDTETFTQSACQRSLIEREEVFNSPGTYTVEFEAEYCSFYSNVWGFCWSGWESHGSDSITIQVQPGTTPGGQLMDYRMEEEDWDGSSGEVTDSSGNGNDATSDFGADTADSNPDPALTGDPGTCRYADLSGDARIQAPRPADINDAESFTLAAWLHMPASEQTLAQPSIIAVGDADPEYGERFEFYRNSDNELVARFRQVDGTIRTLEIGGVFDGDWHHIAVTRQFEQSGNQITVQERLYLDGTEVDQDSESYNPSNADDAYLNDASGDIHMAGFPGPQYPASARMDDVQLFLDDLDSSEIANLSQRRLPCASAELDHFQIDVPANASVCDTADIVVTALDENNNILTDYSGDIVLTTSSGRGNFSPGSTGPGTAAYTFVEADNGSMAFSLSNESADQLTITVSDSGAGISSVSNPIAFSENAFDIQTTDSLGQEVVAGRSHAISVDVLRRDSDTGECGLNTNYDGTVPLRAWVQPSAQDPGGQAPEIAGTALGTGNPGAPNLTLDFSAGQADLELDTTDVGQYRLTFLDQDSGLVVDENDDPIPVVGDSAQLTVRPFGFAIHDVDMNGTANPGGEGPASDIFGTAGTEFSARVMAVQYQPANDSDDDGVPDVGTTLDSVNPTPAFAADGQVDRVEEDGWYTPSEGQAGTLAGGSMNEAQFSTGEVDLTQLRYSEVGSMTLEARVTNYLGAGLDVVGRSDSIGRFIADRLQVDVVEEGSLATGCDSAFSYLRDDLAYSEPPQIRITPVNAAGQHTENYARFPGENWWRLPAIGPAYEDDAIPSAVAGDLLVDAAMADHSPETDQPQNDSVGDNNRLLIELEGTLAYQFATGAAPDVGPFDADFRMHMELIDEDNVQYNNPDDGSATFVHEIAFNESAEQRHGRLNIGNAHGSELLDLQGEVVAQYYNGSNEGWIQNEDDVCTGSDTDSNIELSASQVQGPVTAGDTCIIEGGDDSGMGCGSAESGKNWQEPPVIGEDGDFNAWFAAPGTTGSLRIQATTLPAWLLYDWNNDNDHDDQPEGDITFGIYEGHDRRIDLRETW